MLRYSETMVTSKLGLGKMMYLKCLIMGLNKMVGGSDDARMVRSDGDQVCGQVGPIWRTDGSNF
jgi:hypothetical protein